MRDSRSPKQPPQRVMLGEESTNEMCLAIFQAIVDQPGDSKQLRNAIVGNAFQQIFTSDVPPEVKTHLAGLMRQAAAPMLKAELLEARKRAQK